MTYCIAEAFSQALAVTRRLLINLYYSQDYYIRLSGHDKFGMNTNVETWKLEAAVIVFERWKPSHNGATFCSLHWCDQHVDVCVIASTT